MIHAADSKQLTLKKALKSVTISFTYPRLWTWPEEYGRRRKTGSGTKNMVGDENYGQGRKL